MSRVAKMLCLVMLLIGSGVTPCVVWGAEAPASPKSGTKSPRSDSRIGHTIPNFIARTGDGKEIALADYQDKPVLAVIFLGTECPIGNAYLPFLEEMQKEFASQNVQFLIVNSQGADTPEEIVRHAQAYKITIPVLCDPRQQIANLFGAERMAQAFVLDYRRVIRYSGRIDDRIGYGTKKPEPTRADLKEAITEVLNRKEVAMKETQVLGCLISRKEAVATGEKITYSQHVAHILLNRCQTCHHPGTAAPFALMNYDDAVNWSAMIREVVNEKRMPPWHADPRYSKFSNDCSLTESELTTLTNWIDQGTPQGDPKFLPAARTYAQGWQIGTPDVVFKIPKEVTIPATGVVRYKYFVTPTNFKEDVWLTAAEAKPGNRAVVHHIILFYNIRGKRGISDDTWVVAYAPGSSPLQLDDGFARKIPAGADLVWQLHYTPTGKEEVDQSEVGFKFYTGKEPPRHNVRTRGLYNRRLSIPPEAPNHRLTSMLTFRDETTLLGFMPHMHLRGKSFEYRLKFPDGREQVVLSVPQYDFNWQTSYRLAQPLTVPEGTQLECVAHFDNSAANPANPNPQETVRWGEQTWNEMMIGYFEYYSTKGDTKDLAPTPKVQGQTQRSRNPLLDLLATQPSKPQNDKP